MTHLTPMRGHVSAKGTRLRVAHLFRLPPKVAAQSPGRRNLSPRKRAEREWKVTGANDRLLLLAPSPRSEEGGG